jgi:ompA family membrane protein
MKKKFVILTIGILTFTFCVNSCSKKNDNKSEIVKSKNSKVNNSEMTVPGYALGEVPIIQIPEIPNLSVTENPAAKITLDMTKKISSVPGITITPVKVENGDILGGNYTAQIGKDGKGQLSEGNKVVQSDGNGAGQYINNITGVTLQVDSKGAGQYTDEKNEISLQVNDNGTGMYKNENNGIDIMINEEGATYTSANLVIENNSDGSGEYHDKSKNLLIENNGKGKATITYNGKTVEVDAKPLGKPPRFLKLEMVPPVPAIEANSLLITLDSGILFDVDKYNLRPEAQEILKNLAVVLKEADIKSFEIDGHTDSDASDEYNKTLSDNRAKSVKEFLSSQGVKANIITNGYGESKPIASNDTPEGKQKNRRVEIIIPTM